MIDDDVQVSDDTMRDRFAVRVASLLTPLWSGSVADYLISAAIARASHKIADAMMARREADRVKDAAGK